MAVTLPKINITFKQLATSFIQRSERGIVCLFVACVVCLLFALLWPRVQWGDRSVATEGGYPVLRELPFGPSIAVGAAAALLVF